MLAEKADRLFYDREANRRIQFQKQSTNFLHTQAALLTITTQFSFLSPTAPQHLSRQQSGLLPFAIKSRCATYVVGGFSRRTFRISVNLINKCVIAHDTRNQWIGLAA